MINLNKIKEDCADITREVNEITDDLIYTIKTKFKERGKRIFICDDDKEDLNYFTRVLRAEGYRCVPVSDSEELLKRIKENDLGLLIIDYLIPKLNTLRVIEKLKGDHIPVVIVTGLKDLLIPKQLGKDVILLQKPIKESVLTGVILSVFGDPINTREDKR